LGKYLPTKAKRHIANFFRFVAVYFVSSTFVEVGQQLGFWTHRWIITAGLTAIYFAVAGWFGWRFYTGMDRDGDFFEEE
jgi:hypothetical protein